MKDFKSSTKTAKGHSFPSGFGFSGSTGAVKTVGPYTRKVPTAKRVAGEGALSNMDVKVLKKATGGRVEGNALTQRDKPVNQLDVESGGKTPLRPGYSGGGKVNKILAHAHKGHLPKADANRLLKQQMREGNLSKDGMMGAQDSMNKGPITKTDSVEAWTKSNEQRTIKKALGGTVRAAKGGRQSSPGFNRKPLIGR